MLDKIEDHFILIDKCAGQTRIAEIKDRKLIKYISWFDNNPPQIGNICEATIVKKLNGGVARAKTKDQTILSAFALPAYPYSVEKRLFGIPEAEILKVNDPSILSQNPGY